MAILARNNINFRQKEKLILLDSVYNDKLKTNNAETCYMYNSTPKNDTLAYYSGMLILFMTPPFHKDIHKKSDNGKTYLSLIVSAGKNGLDTYGKCYEKQQELIQAVYNTDIENTLYDMKNYDIEIQNDNYKNNKISKIERDRNIEVINSVTATDVRDFIKNNLIKKQSTIVLKS